MGLCIKLSLKAYRDEALPAFVSSIASISLRNATKRCMHYLRSLSEPRRTGVIYACGDQNQDSAHSDCEIMALMPKNQDATAADD